MTPRHDPPVREGKLGFRAGDWVEVRSAAEILATLDSDGALDALPFMPELLQYCGKRFKVFKSAHKSCDTIRTWRNRRMNDAVHLEGLRCTGEAHDGCQAGCLIYWKETWLKPVQGPGSSAEATTSAATAPSPSNGGNGCDVDALQRATRVPPKADAPAEVKYRCQATEMFRATTAAHWDPFLYAKDITSRNLSPWDFLRYGLLAIVNRFRRFPPIQGRAGSSTPAGDVLDLKAGEWVEVRSKEEILETINGKLRHRGLSFDVEMLPYCGKRFRVLRRVERLIDDTSGKMLLPRTACIILEDVVCGGCLSRNRMFCTRSIYPYWHEVWLKRVETGMDAPAVSGSKPA
jgi:hypothetical protein